MKRQVMLPGGTELLCATHNVVRRIMRERCEEWLRPQWRADCARILAERAAAAAAADGVAAAEGEAME